jgi:transcriptional regulator NrdR family protein
MNCPTCNTPMRVMMTAQLTSEVSRIRRCEKGHTFSTLETFEKPMPKDKRKYNTTRKMKEVKPVKPTRPEIPAHRTGPIVARPLSLMEMLA